MTVVRADSQVAAPPERVFDLYTDFEHASARVKGISRIEVLTPDPVGVGTRFRETRVMMGREATEEMQVARYERPNFVELTAASCGCLYRKTFQFHPAAGGTRVVVEFRATPAAWWARLMVPLAFLFKGMLRKCLLADLADLKAAAEAGAQTPTDVPIGASA